MVRFGYGCDGLGVSNLTLVSCAAKTINFNVKRKVSMRIRGYMLYPLLSSILPLFLFSCGSDRVNLEFKTSKQIYVDDSKTDPDKLNRELEYDLREAEKQRVQKQRAAEAAAKSKAEAEQKARMDQGGQERGTEEETMRANETETPIPQQ